MDGRKPRKFRCLFSRCDILAKTILHAGTTSSSLLFDNNLVDFGTCSGSPFDISSIKYLAAVCPVVERSTVLSRLQSHSKRATKSQGTQVVKDGKFTLLHLRLVETISPLPRNSFSHPSHVSPFAISMISTRTLGTSSFDGLWEGLCLFSRGNRVRRSRHSDLSRMALKLRSSRPGEDIGCLPCAVLCMDEYVAVFSAVFPTQLVLPINSLHDSRPSLDF
jgi:hypothetical protein